MPPVRGFGVALAAGLLVVLAGAACQGSDDGHGSSTVGAADRPESTTSPVNEIYDPYAGTRPAVPPVGRATEGRILTPDGRERHYRLYVPTSVGSNRPGPLLVALHGGLGSAAQFEANSGFDGLAEANGFTVVYPDGIGSRPDGTGPQTWNGGYCCGPAVRQNVDDVGYVRRLIETVRAVVPVDPARVYAAGHSNGAIMAYRLACELSDDIAAIGVQAGSLGIDDCTPVRPVSVFHVHGTADRNHPVDGGLGSGLAGVEFHSARSAVEAMAAADGCHTVPTAAADHSNPDLAVTTWSGCEHRTAVRLVVVEGATHAWMGHSGPSSRAAAYVGEPYPRLDASRAIWSFLAAHPRR